MNREVRIGLGLLAVLGLGVYALLVIGRAGGPGEEGEPLTVGALLGGEGLGTERLPAERYGDAELRVVGWYAELAGDCIGDTGGADAEVAWLQRECPLRVLVPEQPSTGVTQAELERDGLRLAAPVGEPFPARAEPTGPNLRLQQLVFVGHFDDPVAERCLPERRQRCRNTLVVSEYRGLVR